MLTKKEQYFHIFMLLCFSGNPFFTNQKYLIFVYGLYLFFKFLFASQKNYAFLNKEVIKFTLVIITIFILQFFILGYVSVLGSFNYIYKILLGALVVYLLGNSFRIRYFEVMYFICAVSLVFFLINKLGIELPAIYENGRNKSLLIFTQIEGEDSFGIRNPGMFWEPGAFGGYLLLIPLLFINNLSYLWKNHRNKCVVIFITLVSTFSTSAFLIFFLIFTYFLASKSKQKIFSFFLIPVFIGAFYVTFTELDFLQSKIEEQIKTSNERDIQNDFYSDRFSSFMFDTYYISKHPFIGNGFHSKTRYADHQHIFKDEYTQVFGHGNGLSNFIASMGIPLLILYFILIYKKYPFKKKDNFFIIVILLLMLQSEQYLNYPLFLALPFVNLNFKKNE